MGDPAGIGPEIILKAYQAREARSLPPFAVFGGPALLSRRAADFAIEVPVVAVDSPAEAARAFDRGLPVISVGEALHSRPGEPDPANAGLVVKAIERAVAAVVGHEASALVTCPIAKSVLYAAGFAHPGHTEFLAALARRLVPNFQGRPVMMLASDELRAVPLTIHIPLAAVPQAVTAALIEETVLVLARALEEDFGIARPRIAVAGLNPHAGENGTIGREDEEIVRPAIAALRDRGIDISGPEPADTMFHAAARARYDAALAMYHDQALIPLKTLAFDTGVNVTLGLPFVRTSPDHGTAFDIAARGTASPESLIRAMRLAAEMAARRERLREERAHS